MGIKDRFSSVGLTNLPVAEKAIKCPRQCKDPALIGIAKEIIKQVSHSKKWSSEKALDENSLVIQNKNGRAVFINAYSLLQNRFFEHMWATGFGTMNTRNVAAQWPNRSYQKPLTSYKEQVYPYSMAAVLSASNFSLPLRRKVSFI